MRKIHQALQEAELYLKSNQVRLAFEKFDVCESTFLRYDSDHDGDLEWMFIKAVLKNSKGVAHMKANEMKPALMCFRESYDLKALVLQKQGTASQVGGRNTGGGQYDASCDLVAPLFNMGRVYHCNKQYDDARHYYKEASWLNKKKAVSINAAENIESNKLTIAILLQLCILHNDLKKYKEAKRSIAEAIELAYETFGQNDISMANLYTHLGKVHFNLKDYGKARKCYDDALLICLDAGITGKAPMVLQKLVTEADAKIADAEGAVGASKTISRSKSSTLNSDHLIRYISFLADVYSDESSRFYNLIISKSIQDKHCESFIQLQSTLTKKHAESLNSLCSMSGLDLSMLVETLYTFYHERMVIIRHHIKHLDTTPTYVFSMQMELFHQLDQKLRVYYQLIKSKSEKSPTLSNIATTLADSYHDFEKVMTSSSHNYSTSYASVEKITVVVHATLKGLAKKLKVEARYVSASYGRRRINQDTESSMQLTRNHVADSLKNMTGINVEMNELV